ncbi:MAG: hypothetical protein HY790_13185 [Deltaproteobacteria bacterium]|nr:hypothetical protein [Deltaproteobacteria bacterium]
MEGLNHGSPSLFGKGEEVFRTLAPQIILIHHRQVLAETQLIIRFANGYGVALLPVSPAGDDPILEMLVLRFHGPKINDHKLVQYAPVPEFNRGNFDEIMDLCRQVSLLPPNRTLTLCPGQSAARIKKGAWEKRCSNF